MQIKIIGWQAGFNKVSLNKYLRKELNLDTKQSKDIVDNILNDQEVTLEINDSEDLITEIENTGAVIEVINKENKQKEAP
ncbi:hypothetical protein [Thalassomonas sp. RHCl1]|uniref:hypothetical protein n=1 Tax=Thalassomonas sp. RHCl1 TaxID=2995320 RepID=UPI00248C4D6C|nr:hypothetical protein [Thalassomonas sp. RHCl1]